MKKLLSLILLILISCSEPEPVNIDLMLELKDNFYTYKNSDKVFSGIAFSEFDSGQKQTIGKIKKGKKNGLWTNYHEDGKVKSKIMFEDGILIDLQPINGDFFEFDGDGNKIKSGSYLDGKKNGLFKSPSGEFSYKNDILDGPFVDYNTEEFGQIEGTWINTKGTLKGTYKNGVLDGPFVFIFFPTSYGERAEGFFKNGKKEGVQTIFFKNGRKKAVVNFSNGKKHGLETIYGEDELYKITHEINYKDGKKHGTSISYGHTKPYSEAYYGRGDYVMWSITNYSHGEKDGPYKEFNYTQNGERFITEEGTWDSGNKVGSNKIYYMYSGILKVDSFYVNGFHNGPYKEYDENGNILIDANKKGGKFIGLYKRYQNGNLELEKTIDSEGKLIGGIKTYYKNGKLALEGNYEIGDYQDERFYPNDYGAEEHYGRRRVGAWKYYSKSGKIIKEIIYEDGRVIDSINY